MSFFKRRYAALFLLILVFLTCSADNCSHSYDVLIGEASGDRPFAEREPPAQTKSPQFHSSRRPRIDRFEKPVASAFMPPPATDAVVLFAGGAIYNPSAEILTLGASPSFAPTNAAMLTDRTGQTANLITSGPFNGQVLIAGGHAISGISGAALATAERYNSSSGTFCAAHPRSIWFRVCPSGRPNLPSSRSASCIAC